MFLKALQTSLKSLNTETSTSSPGKTLWGLIVTSVLSATWFYHLPLIDLRLFPKARKQSLGIAAQLLPWAHSSLLPWPASPTKALCTGAGHIPWLPASLHCRPRAFCQQKDTNPCRDHAGYKHPTSGLFLWHRGYSLVLTVGQTWCWHKIHKGYCCSLRAL